MTCVAGCARWILLVMVSMATATGSEIGAAIAIAIAIAVAIAIAEGGGEEEGARRLQGADPAGPVVPDEVADFRS